MYPIDERRYLLTMRMIGRKPVLELLQSGKPVQRVRIALGTQGKIIGDIIAEAKKHGVRVDRVAPDVVKRTFGAGNHQGVVADTAPTELLELSDLDSQRSPVRYGLVIALDGVTDPHHLGAIARSALAAGCDALVITARRSAPLSDTAVKASAGTLTRLPVIQVSSLGDALMVLQKDGWWIHGAGSPVSGDAPKLHGAAQAYSHQDDRVNLLWDHVWDERTVLVIGSEGEGLSHRVKKLCDHLVAIPMAENVESLSASAAASVILFDIARKRQLRDGQAGSSKNSD
ncbi:MAG: 23S rRNA (guanosine(2251)-2'-O)-methyltransferase RlmB [bacterium]